MAEQSESESSEESSSETSFSKEDYHVPSTSTKEGFDNDAQMELDQVILEESESVKAWVNWCRSHTHARCVEYDVPSQVLPKGFTGVLIDVKVGVKGKRTRVPDDKIYLAHEDLRRKVARGNCVLELNKIEKGKISRTTHILLVFALKKFSGGLGDEDDSDNDRSDWMKYFQKDISKAKTMVSTEKANGEAAHVSSLKMFGTHYFCIGSKNVHMLVRNFEDVNVYKDERFEFARRIARTFFTNYFNNGDISVEQKQSFLSFIQQNQYTAVFEMLQPQNQHVVNLSYLQNPVLKFICWTKADLEEEFYGKNTLCPLPVNEALQMAKDFGLSTIDHETVHLRGQNEDDIKTEIENYMEKIRGDYGHEGKVLYFLDDDNVTIGLIKKKTVWYIILRALREKVANLSSKNPMSLSDLNQRITKRIQEMQRWLGFSDRYAKGWIKICTEFATWLHAHKHRTISSERKEDIRSSFPVKFERFLTENESSKLEYDDLIKSFELKSS